MPLELATLDPTLLPLALGALFSFGGGKKKLDPTDPLVLQAITRCVSEFLTSRGVEKFKVFTLVIEGEPSVHIQAEAHKNLRFSNLIEHQIRQRVEEQMAVTVGPVFWRFQMDTPTEPGREQVSYEDYPTRPGDTAPVPAVPRNEQPSAPVEPHRDEGSEHYDIRRVTAEGMAVEELSLADVEAFFKDTPPGKGG